MSSGCFLALRSPLTASFYQVWWYVQSIGRTKVNQSFSHGIFKTRLILVLSLPYWGCTNLCAPLKSPRNVSSEAWRLRKTLIFSKHALKHTLKLTPVNVSAFRETNIVDFWLSFFTVNISKALSVIASQTSTEQKKKKQPLPFMLIFFVFLMVGI